MAGPLVLIFHRPASASDPSLVRLVADVRARLADDQAALFRAAGAGEVRLVARDEDAATPATFGEALAGLAPRRGGVVVLGSGAVPRLGAADARRLVAVAGSGERRALTNNRYSSDICAVGAASLLRRVPPLPSDNALPRWLEEHARYDVGELPGRARLALDIDTAQDVALWSLAPGAPAWLRRLVADTSIGVPRRDELRTLAGDAHAELVVFGRSGSRTLRWLERNVRCRVRFLAEERGLRASSPLAIGGRGSSRPTRPPRASLGLLLEHAGPSALGEIVAQLGDGAIVDSRVLLAHRFGGDEAVWPSAADRFASDLLRPPDVSDPWLAALTEAAASSRTPILLGSHTLLGPGIPLLLRPAARVHGARSGSSRR